MQNEKMIQTKVPSLWIDMEGRLFEKVEEKFYLSIYGGAEPAFGSEFEAMVGDPPSSGDPRDPAPDDMPNEPVGDNKTEFQDDEEEEDSEEEVEEGDENIPPAAEDDEEESKETPASTAEGEEDLELGDEPLTERERYLVAKINELSGVGIDGAQTPQTTQIEFEPIDFVGDQDIDEILDTKESLNKFMMRVYESGARAAANIVSQQVPQQVSSTVTRAQAMKEIVDEFYSQNEDLDQMRHTVAMVASEIIKETPDVPMNDLMNQAAERTRKMLRLPPKSKVTPKGKSISKNKRPAFAGPNRGRGAKPKDRRDSLEKEVADLVF